MKRKILACALFLAAVAGCEKNLSEKTPPSDESSNSQASQQATPQSPNSAMNPDSLLYGWLKYAGPDHKFTVMFPAFPKEKQKSDQTPHGEMQVHVYASEKDASTDYSVACYDFPPIQGDPKMFLARLEGIFVKGQDAKVVSFKPIQVDNYYGTEFEFVAGGQANYSGKCRLILVGQRAYALAVVYLTAGPQPTDCDAFFNSLSILQN